MPTPTKGEKRSHFISRCVPYVMREAGTKSRDHAVAKCHGIWESRSKRRVSNARRVNPLRMDPTRTTALVRRFSAELTKRFRRLKGELLRLIVEEDAFGLRPKNRGIVLRNTRWKPLRTDQQMQEFKQWLQQQLNEGILTTTDPRSPRWLEDYVRESYERGAGRAFDDWARKYEAAGASQDFVTGSKSEFLRSFRGPASVERVRLMADRVFTDLKGVTEAMSTQMNRVLTDGLIQGKHPFQLARDLNDRVDKIGITRARTIARTEVIRSFADGQLDALKNLGVEEVGVMVEWSAAGDDLVCPLCQDMDGAVLKIDEARSIIPRHPNCRCAWIPANIGESKSLAQRRSQSRIERSIRRSVGKERRKGESLKDAMERTSWAGADKKISKQRPKAVVGEALSSKARKIGAAAVKASNLGPTIAAELAKESGVSPRIAKIALVAATIGDFSVPGVPVGSAAISILATIKSPGAGLRLSRNLIEKLIRMF